MIVSELRLFNFRQFGSTDGSPGLEIYFHKGINALVGENDSGKTTVIDALKLVLLTQSGEYIRPVEEDFHVAPNGRPTREFRIECVISGMSANEAKNFVEHLTVDGRAYSLRLFYRAWREGRRIFTELLVGDRTDGSRLDGKARELLKVVYLKPLRDAEREMSAGRRSRLSQILLSHPAFREEEGHPVLEAFKDANHSIEGYFTEDGVGKMVLGVIRENLAAFHDETEERRATIETAAAQLRSILESLSLRAGEIGPGLGELNVLFMAAELLLLRDDDEGCLKTALVEELEAHLHPQAQLRLIDYLQREYGEFGAQIIITTHSPVLASKIDLKNLILLKGGRGYDMTEGHTKLRKGDYLFLQRFLDATKANLFFAKGVVMVEGDAESILLPVLADVIGCPLERYGVSVVNVGGTAFLRYSGIMARADGTSVGIPVAVVTDCDVQQFEKGSEAKGRRFADKPDEAADAMKRKFERYSFGDVRAFVSPRWTLEYCIAMSCLQELLVRAILYGKKVYNSDSDPLNENKVIEVESNAESTVRRVSAIPSKAEQAYEVYRMMLSSDGTSKLKAIVAQCLASLIRWEISDIPEDYGRERMFDYDLLGLNVNKDKRDVLRKQIETDSSLSYLVSAIRYACNLQPLSESSDA